MPEPCKFPSLDNGQKGFLLTHKEVDLASHPAVGLVTPSRKYGEISLCTCFVQKREPLKGLDSQHKGPQSLHPLHPIACDFGTGTLSFVDSDNSRSTPVGLLENALCRSLCTLNLLARQVTFAVGDSGLCCCVPRYSWDVCRALLIPFVC